MPKRLTTEEFKKQLSLEHPELELLGEYNGNKNYVTVRCVIHNHIFRTKPNWLHAGTGCQKCYDERRGDTLRKSTESFIEEARKIHGDKYDYSKVVYDGNKKKVCIICPEHGEFWQTPNKHISSKQGCPKCSSKNITTEEWIDKANKIHNNKYDYSKVEYKNNKTKVCIICPKHGEFWQTPDKHIQGEGCPICNNSRMELSLRKYLDENEIPYVQQKCFNWLGKKKLDFYLTSHNVAIECQGRQHFVPINHFGGLDGFRKRLRNDIAKYEECKENNVKLIYVINDKDIKKTKNRKFLNIYNENIIKSEKINKLKKLLS